MRRLLTAFDPNSIWSGWAFRDHSWQIFTLLPFLLGPSSEATGFIHSASTFLLITLISSCKLVPISPSEHFPLCWADSQSCLILTWSSELWWHHKQRYESSSGWKESCLMPVWVMFVAFVHFRLLILLSQIGNLVCRLYYRLNGNNDFLFLSCLIDLTVDN